MIIAINDKDDNDDIRLFASRLKIIITQQKNSFVIVFFPHNKGEREEIFPQIFMVVYLY
jgi:hypothetical protein